MYDNSLYLIMRFTESQQFPNWLRYGILLFTIILFIIIVRSNGPNQFFPMTIIGLLIGFPGYIIHSWTQLTDIDTSYINIKVKPFVNKQIPFTDIESWTVRSYKPILEYGGWGIRWGLKGTAYNVTGNKGLQLVLNSGKKILIGTQKDIELNRMMKSVSPEKEQALADS